MEIPDKIFEEAIQRTTDLVEQARREAFMAGFYHGWMTGGSVFYDVDGIYEDWRRYNERTR